MATSGQFIILIKNEHVCSEMVCTPLVSYSRTLNTELYFESFYYFLSTKKNVDMQKTFGVV